MSKEVPKKGAANPDGALVLQGRQAPLKKGRQVRWRRPRSPGVTCGFANASKRPSKRDNRWNKAYSRLLKDQAESFRIGFLADSPAEFPSSAPIVCSLSRSRRFLERSCVFDTKTGAGRPRSPVDPPQTGACLGSSSVWARLSSSMMKLLASLDEREIVGYG
jgi:hypothetical protein